METAIALIAFVVVASVFAFGVLSLGLFSSDKAKETVRAGMEEARSTLEVQGSVIAKATLTTATGSILVAESVGTGNGNKKTFSLPNDQIIPNSETIYLDGALQTREVDYTMSYSGGVVTFTTAPASGVVITADYQPTVELIGTGDGSTTTFTLANSPVISGSETIYVDVTEVARSEYTINHDTGVVTFNTAPPDGEAVEAKYTYYTISEVTFLVGNAAGSQPINLAPGALIVTYIDKDTLVTNVTDLTLTKAGNADADNLLERGEVFGIAVNTSTYGLVGGQQFTIELKPEVGAVTTLNRTIPVGVDPAMVLH